MPGLKITPISNTGSGTARKRTFPAIAVLAE